MKIFLTKALSTVMIISAFVAVTIALALVCELAYAGQRFMSIIVVAISALYAWGIFQIDKTLEEYIRNETQKCELTKSEES